MADLNDLLKPDASSNYSSEVLQSIKGHISRLWLGDYTGMSNLVANMRRWVDLGSGDAKLVKRNTDGSETTIFDSSTKATTSYVDSSVVNKANSSGSNAYGTWAINVTGNAATATAATSATNATNAANLVTTNWTIQEVGGKLVFKHSGTVVASMGTDGSITSAQNITAYGTP